MTLKVIGAGFGRTGTNTLKVVLEKLGFGPCYHMYEVMEKPNPRIQHWADIVDGKAPDWDVVFEGFNSGVDWPVSAYWRELAAYYPDAKIVLSERDADAWFKSISNTIFKTWDAPLGDDVPPEILRLREMTSKMILEGTFGGNVADKDHVLSIYKKNGDDARAAFRPDRLLTFDPNQGWEPLCAFLGVPVPNEDFPHTNTTKDFMAGRKGKPE